MLEAVYCTAFIWTVDFYVTSIKLIVSLNFYKYFTTAKGFDKFNKFYRSARARCENHYKPVIQLKAASLLICFLLTCLCAGWDIIAGN
jgi:hypothetical protein